MSKLEILELGGIGERRAGERAAGLDRVANAGVIEDDIIIGVECLGDRVRIAQRIGFARAADVVALFEIVGAVEIAGHPEARAELALGDGGRFKLRECVAAAGSGCRYTALLALGDDGRFKLRECVAAAGTGCRYRGLLELGDGGSFELAEALEGVVAFEIEVAEVVERVVAVASIA